MTTDFTTPADLARFCHEVPKRATIPARTPFVDRDENGYWRIVSKGLSYNLTPADRFGYWTLTPIPDPGPSLPTEPGSLIIAHTADDPTRRVFMRTQILGTWCRPGFVRLYWGASELIDPVPAEAVEVQS